MISQWYLEIVIVVELILIGVYSTWAFLSKRVCLWYQLFGGLAFSFMSSNVFSNILELYPSIILSSSISDNKRHYTPYVFSPPNSCDVSKFEKLSHFFLSPFVLSSEDSPRSGGRGAWWATVQGVAKSWTWLTRLSTRACMPLDFISWVSQTPTLFSASPIINLF